MTHRPLDAHEPTLRNMIEQVIGNARHLLPIRPAPGVLPDESHAIPASATTAAFRPYPPVENDPSSFCRDARNFSPFSIAGRAAAISA